MRTFTPLLALLVACNDVDGDGTPDRRDCSVGDPTINEDAVEICNGIDDNCDGYIDEGVSTVAYWDRDGDGYGDEAYVRRVCTVPTDGATVGGDCDDADPLVSPLGVETCDGRDENCDGAIDEGAGSEFWPDADGDGHGVETDAVTTCIAPSGYAAVADDCDDADPRAWTDAEELCDGADNNCNAEIDEDLPLVRVWVDADGDGGGDPASPAVACGALDGFASLADDCDDTDPAIGPYSIETAENSVDDDCDGYEDEIAVPDHVETLEDALAIAAPGDVVQLGEGTWSQTVDLTGTGVVLAGAGCGRTVVYADGLGTAITLDGGGVERLSVVGGAGVQGGGLLVNGNAEVSDVCVWGNQATDGAGIAVLAGTLLIHDSAITTNAAADDGGGIYVGADAGIDGWALEVTGNKANSDGGGAYVDGDIHLESSVFARNAVVDDGAGLALAGAAGPIRELWNLTIDANSGPSDGPALWTDSTVDVRRTLVTNHPTDRAPLRLRSATTAAMGVYGNGAADSDNGYLVDTLREDPRYQSTSADAPDWRLALGSPAIDADATALDPDGSPADLGAYGGPLAPAGFAAPYADDSDADGLVDGWEWRMGTNPWVADAAADPDGDGLTNAEELAAGSRADLMDSDADGVGDGDDLLPADPRNHAPEAAAPYHLFGVVGEVLVLDGRRSSDPDDEPLDVQWTLVDSDGAPVGLLDQDAEVANFTPDAAGTYVATLTVEDGGAMASVDVLIDVIEATVVSDDDEFAAAWEAAESGDAIALLPGTYVGGYALDGRNLTLVGLGTRDDVVLDGFGVGPVLDASQGEWLTVAHVTIQHGVAPVGGGITSVDGMVHLVDVALLDNRATSEGGGLWTESSDIWAEDVEFSGNTAADGGAARVEDGDQVWQRVGFTRNSATRGGAIYFDIDSSSSASLDNVWFANNAATTGAALYRDGLGAAINAHQLGAVGNTGASVFYLYTSELFVENGLFANNTGKLIQRRVTAIAPKATLLFPLVAHTGVVTEPATPLFSPVEGIPAVSLVTGSRSDIWTAPPHSAAFDSGRPERIDLDGSRSDVGPWGGPLAPRGYAAYARDLDTDGLPDGWETNNGLNAHVNDTLADLDSDTLTNAQEYALGTSPARADSDGDGVDDAADAAPTDATAHRPVANAGPDGSVRRGQLWELDGAASTDPDGDALQFRWHLAASPDESTLTDADLHATGSKVTLTPDVRGVYRIALVVNDAHGASAPDFVHVTAWDELSVPGDYADLDAALADAVDNDVIRLAAGIWEGHLTTGAHTVTLRGAGVNLTTVLGPRDAPLAVIEADGALIAEDLTLKRGLGDHGGVITCEDGELTTTRVRITRGVAQDGGGVSLDNCTANLTDTDIVDNAASLQAGGLWALESTITWKRGELADNISESDVGGGMYLLRSTVTLKNLLARDNSSVASGGAIYSSSGDLNVTYSTFLRNKGPFGALTIASGSLYLGSSLFAEHATTGLWRSSSTVLVTTAKNAWFNNRISNTYPTTLATISDVYANPELAEDARLTPFSPLRNGGVGTDPDGTVADIGAFGGPDAKAGFNGLYVDADADDLADAWETLHGLTSASADPDGDTLLNSREFLEGTDPNHADSDADGVDDDEELANADDPLDARDHAPFVSPSGRGDGVGDSVELLSDGTYDPDSQPLSYQWSFVALPGRSTLTNSDFSDATAETTEFTPDTPGTYVVALTVDDGTASTTVEWPVVVDGDVLVPDDYATIAEAIAAVADGGAVYIDAGTWPVNLDVGARDVHLIGAGAESTRLDAGDRGRAFTLGEIGSTTLEGLAVIDGFDARGGAIFTEGAPVDLTDVVIAHNRGAAGGAIWAENADLLLTDVDIDDHYATDRGGAVSMTDATLDAVRTRWWRNTTPESGGALYAMRTTIAMNNAIFADNHALTGGALSLAGTSTSPTTVALSQITAVHNTSESSGGALYAYSTTVTCNGCLFAYNDLYAAAVQSSASFQAHYGLTFENSGGDWSMSNAPVSGQNGNLRADPMFVALSDDGDPTNDDLHLQTSSPGVNAGDETVLDANGTRADIGAYGGPEGSW